MLGSAGGRRAVVLAHHDHPGVVRAWLRELAEDHVTVLYLHGVPAHLPTGTSDRGPTYAAVDDLATLTRQLTRLGQLDVVVVTAPSGKLAPVAADHYGLLPHVLFHLRPGGVLAIDRTLQRDDNRPLAPERWHRMLVTASSGSPLELEREERALAQATRALFVSRRYVIAVKRGRHLFKLREDDVDPVLLDREPDLCVSTWVTLPPGSTEVAGPEHMHGDGLAPLPLRLDHPELAVRHYQGDIVSRGATFLYSGGTLLPESFRWPWANGLTHPSALEVSDDFVEVGRNPRRTLEGDYFFIDCVFSGHFGHLMTEMVARLWGWEHAKRHAPEVKALFHVRNSPGKTGELERKLFAAYGIPESALVSTDHPVRLDSVIGASPMWHNRAPFYAHPDIRETWARLTSGLLSGREPATHPRIFVSRGRDVRHRRSCRNQDEVERFFADRGFVVLYPEEHSLEEQVAIFAGARVVAGFAGSAMFNLMHCRRLEAVVVLSHSAYVHRNEHLFARLHGAQLHHFWSPHDALPESAGPRAYARAPWGFDFAGLGSDLDRVLAGL